MSPDKELHDEPEESRRGGFPREWRWPGADGARRRCGIRGARRRRLSAAGVRTGWTPGTRTGRGSPAGRAVLTPVDRTGRQATGTRAADPVTGTRADRVTGTRADPVTGTRADRVT